MSHNLPDIPIMDNERKSEDGGSPRASMDAMKQMAKYNFTVNVKLSTSTRSQWMEAMLQKFRPIDYEFPVQYLRIDVATQTEQQVMGLDNLVWTAGHGNADFLVKNNLAIHIITNNINSRQFNWTKGFKTAAGMWHKIRLQFVSSQNEKVASLIHDIDRYCVEVRHIDDSLDKLRNMYLDLCECNGHVMSEQSNPTSETFRCPPSPLDS